MQITTLIKRNNTLEDFDVKKIIFTIHKAMIAKGIGNTKDAEKVSNIVLAKLNRNFSEKWHKNTASNEQIYPNVEEIQDIVEESLMESGYHDVAKAYIIYRQKHDVASKKRLV